MTIGTNSKGSGSGECGARSHPRLRHALCRIGGATLRHFLSGALEAYGIWHRLRADQRALLEMDGRMLRDIGITRYDARREARRPLLSDFLRELRKTSPVMPNDPPPRRMEALVQRREKFIHGGVPREIIEAAMEEARTQRSATLYAFAAKSLRRIGRRTSARQRPHPVCPPALDRFGYRFFGQLFRALRLAPNGDTMFPGASGADRAIHADITPFQRTTMHIPNVLTQFADGIATWTINRPDKHNALDYATIDALLDLLDDAEDDRAVRAIILTGAGDKAFSAGADIAGFSSSVAAGVDTALKTFLQQGQRLTGRLENFPKPVIAAVNGLAFGGGCEVTEAVPLAIASDRARFGKPEIDLGMLPTFGGTQRLARLIGRKRALRMILTGQPIAAEEALALGLVNAVVPHDRLPDEARRLALAIAAKAPSAVRACLGSVTQGLNMGIDQGLAVEAAYFAQLVPTRDLREGIDAFLEKRPPRFVGA